MSEEKDSLEDFVNAHRDEFPQYEPSPDLWSRIQGDVQQHQKEAQQTEPGIVPIAPANEPKTIKLSTLYRAAAILVLGLVTGYGIWGVEWGDNSGISNANDSTTVNPNDELPVVNNYYISLKDLSPELAEVEQFYSSQIQERTEELQALQVGDQYMDDMTMLDDEMKTLQQEVSQNMDNERVIEAMVENYRMRLDLLENLLNELKKDNGASNGNTPNNSRDEKKNPDVQS
jgi:hypothetical protein